MENMAIKKVLITGSEGYIGSVLVKKLLEGGYDVTGLDTLFFKPAQLEPTVSYRLLKKDIRKIVLKDLQGIDAVIHLAALSNDALGELRSGLTDSINFKATKHLAILSKKAGVKRFIFSSSCSVYGKSNEALVNENSAVNPLTEYAKSKVLSEKTLKDLAENSFCTTSLRNSTVYGYSPAFRNDLVINNFTTCAYALGELRIDSDGSPWRPLIDVRDLADTFLHFLKISSEKINAQIFNIGFNSNNLQINSLVTIIKEAFPACKIIYTGKQPDSRSYKVDFSKLEELLPNLKQKWTIEKSILDLVENLKQTKYSKNDFLSKKHFRLDSLNKLKQNKKITSNLYWREGV